MRILEEKIRREISLTKAEAVGVAFHSPSHDSELLLNADHVFHAASTMKIGVMMEAYRADQAGEFSLDSEVSVVNCFPSIVDGSPYSLRAEDDSDPLLYEKIGHRLPARQLVERMIVRSSNLATNILIEVLRPHKVNSFMHELGAKDLLIRRGVEDNQAYRLGLNNLATPRSLNAILLKLLEGKAVSAKADQQMIDILLKQEFNEGIPKLLPPNARVAHKTGWNGPLYHNTGIVYPPQAEPYVLTVMTQGLSGEEEGPELVAKISHLIYGAFSV